MHLHRNKDLNNIFPHHLVPRPAEVRLDPDQIRLGDIVYVQLRSGREIASKVIFNSPVQGCTTFTGDAHMALDEDTVARPVRVRFRPQDIHRVQQSA